MLEYKCLSNFVSWCNLADIYGEGKLLEFVFADVL